MPYVTPTDKLDIIMPYVQPTDTLDIIMPYVQLTDTLDVIMPYVQPAIRHLLTLQTYSFLQTSLDTSLMLTHSKGPKHVA
jgi:hypothetical protein